MTQPMSLGNYEPQSHQPSDALQAQQVVDRPILVYILEKKWISKTRYNPAGDWAVVLDLLDIMTGQVFSGVMWMNGALVDGLSRYANSGQALAIKLQYTQGKNPNGKPYIGIVPLEGSELAQANDWVTKYPNLFADAREQKGYGPYQFSSNNQAGPQGFPAPGGPQGGFSQPAAPAANGWGASTPQPAAPASPFGAPAAAPAQQFQAPAPAPAANGWGASAPAAPAAPPPAAPPSPAPAPAPSPAPAPAPAAQAPAAPPAPASAMAPAGGTDDLPF